MQDSVFSPPIALPPFSKRSPIKSGDFSNATVELVKLVRRKLVSVPLWHKLLFLKGVNLDLGILVMRLPTTQIACLGQLNVSVPLRGFWYADSVSQYPLPDWAHRRFFQTSGFFRLFRGPR